MKNIAKKNIAKLVSLLLPTRIFSTPRRRRSRMQLAEMLESRNLLSGNVLVEISRGSLNIRGDNADNNVIIIAEQGNLVVRGLEGTTINGSADDVILQTGSTTIERNVRARMKKGDDTLTFSGVTISRNAFVNAGKGDDELGFNDVTVGGSLRVIGHSGNDGVWLNDANVQKRTVINAGKGDDTVFVEGTQTGKNMHIRASRGNNDIRIEEVNVGGNLKVRTGSGEDDVAATDVTVGKNAKLNLGRGDDAIVVKQATAVTGSLKVQGGRGSDQVEVEGTVTVGGETKARGVEQDTIDADVLASRFDEATTGLFAVTDALKEVFTDIIEPEALALTVETTNNQTVQSNDILVVKDANFQIDGTTSAGATVEVDVDGDGDFDDGTATADADGNFSVDTTLLNNATNRGANNITVRSTDTLDRETTQTLDIHFAAGTVSRFVTSAGTFDVELFDADAPTTVANFLAYDERYNNSIFHRSAFTQTGGDFIVQGGGFHLNPDLEEITTDAAIQNEFNAANSNLRGTLSMALGANAPDSGTSQWFFNTVDNAALDNALHTVFGFVIGSGMDVVDAIHDFTTFNLNTVLNQGALGELPLDGYERLTDNLTGTVETTENSTTVTGTDTLFSTELNVGQQIKIGDEIFVVAVITSDTELTLNVAAAEAVADVTPKTDAVPTDDQFITISDINSALFA